MVSVDSVPVDSTPVVNWSQRAAHAVLAIAVLVLAVATFYGYLYGVAIAPLPRPPLEHNWTAIVGVLAGDGYAGARDGSAYDARFSDPFGIAVAPDGSVYVSDAGDAQRIRRIGSDGAVTSLAGSVTGFADGTGTAARFDTPSAVAIGPDDALYVADTGNNTIRRVTVAGVVTTLTGSRAAGYRDGLTLDAQFNGPVGVAVDASGRVIVADTYNDRIRAIGRDGQVTTIAGSGRRGYADGPAGDAQFDTPCGVAIDPQGTIFVADSGNGLIRRIDRDGTVATVDLLPEHFLLRPLGITLAADGQLYATDDRGRVIEITVNAGQRDADGAAHPTGEMRVLAGESPGFVNGAGTAARMRGLAGIAVSGDGHLVVADPRNAMIREITARGHAEVTPPSPPALHGGFDEAAFAEQPLIWPVDPMAGPHEITGTQGEARGAETMGRFHAGLDVHAAEGTPVRAVRDGVVTNPVSTAEFGTLNESLRIGGVTYVHLRAGRRPRSVPLGDARFVISRDDKGRIDQIRVRRGARFQSGDVLGTVNPFNHVHLNIGWPGEEINPLRFRIPFFEDTVPPTITAVHLLTVDGQPFDPTQGNAVAAAPGKSAAQRRRLAARSRAPLVVDQPVQIVVDTWDQVDGNEPQRRLGLYRLGYQILHKDGTPVAGFERPRETMRFDRIAPDPEAPSLVYASGSGIPFYARHATQFLYVVTNAFHDGHAAMGVWDPRPLAPGDYVIRVLAEDIRGNRAQRGMDLPVTVR
jgi:sugar lactone lactonase YvrE